MLLNLPPGNLLPHDGVVLRYVRKVRAFSDERIPDFWIGRVVQRTGQRFLSTLQLFRSFLWEIAKDNI